MDFNNPAALFDALGGPGKLPVPKIRSPASVRKEATDRSGKVFTLYETLNAIVARHEATIQKRWSKKTRQQRLKILLKAWPEMAAVHRPDFDSFWRQSDVNRRGQAGRYESCLWPSVNQEDLSDTRTLLLLLNARGRHPPAYFAAADNDAMHLGVVTQAIVPCFLNEHVLMLNGMTENSRDYGKLVCWNDEPEAFFWMANQKQPQPGEGLLILEVQQRLLGFLVDCCKDILHDIPESTLTADSFPILPESQLKRASEISGFESLSVLAAEAPYRVPARLDLDLVKSLLATRASAAEDHLWHLREDPNYFAAEVLDTKEHRQEMIKDWHGRNHPILDPSRSKTLWVRVVGNLVVTAYITLEYFSELSRQASNLASLQQKYADAISPLQNLPKDYHDALLLFQHTLNQAAKGPLGQLKYAAVASPPLRRFFTREPAPDARSTRITVEQNTNVQMNNIEAKMIWFLRTLWEDGNDLFLTTLPLIMDELERFIKAESEARQLLSPFIMDVINDLSIIAQCIKQLNLYKPWSQTFETDFVEREEEFKREFALRAEPWSRMLSAMHERNIGTVAQLGNPSGGRFTYPIERRRNQQNVDALRKAEANLDSFWAEVDRVMLANGGDLSGTDVWDLLVSQQRVLQRTPEWVEQSEKKASGASTERKPSLAAQGDLYMASSYQPISRIYCGISPRSLDINQPNNKVKTRGTPHRSTSTAADLKPSTNTDPQPEPTIPVDGRTLKVFRTLFFNPSVTSTPGEIPWNDFLHAMTSVGFTALHLYGSVWQFEPGTNWRWDVERRIQFHEPHPKGKVSFVVARRFGRRLNRAFGWVGGMFVEEKRG